MATTLEREIMKVAFQRDISLDAATRVVFWEWSRKMQQKDAIEDAYDYVFGDDAKRRVEA